MPAFADYRSLLEIVDAVSVAVPTFKHHEVASEFLSRGIPTLVEKPLATSAAEAESLVNLASSRNTILQVGHIERFNPAAGRAEIVSTAPEVHQRGAIGDVYLSFDRHRGHPRPDDS